MSLHEIPEKDLIWHLPIAIKCPFIVNRNAPGFFECLSLSFVSLLFCGPEDSSLYSIFRQQSYQGSFKFGNPTPRPVSTIMKSSPHKEVNHWSCRTCLLTNFEQKPADLSPKRYNNSMILWLIQAQSSPALLALFILVLRIHSLPPGRRTALARWQL